METGRVVQKTNCIQGTVILTVLAFLVIPIVNAASSGTISNREAQQSYSYLKRSKVLDLTLDENTGTIASDQSGNGNNGELNAMAQWTSSGRYKGGLRSNGASLNGLNVTDTFILRPENMADGFTWSVWVYPVNMNSNVLPMIMQKGPQYLCIMGDTYNWAYQRFALALTNSSGQEVEYWSTSTLKLDSWQHIAVAWDGNQKVEFYLNGAYEPISYTFFGPLVGRLMDTSAYPLIVGDDQHLPRAFNGTIDNVAFYNRALTKTEIYSIYNGESMLAKKR